MAQQKPQLTVAGIMQDPRWMGTAPSAPYWAEDGSRIFFGYNPDRAAADSLYAYDFSAKKIIKITPAERRRLPAAEGVYDRAFTRKLYQQQGDIFLYELKTATRRQLTATPDDESNPQFSADEQSVIFRRGQNLFQLGLNSGRLSQLTQLLPGRKKPEAKPSIQEKWLRADQLSLFEVLREKQARRRTAAAIERADEPRQPKAFYLDERLPVSLTASPDGRLVTFELRKPAPDARPTFVPAFVTESGFTESLPARTKVGAPLGVSELYLYDVAADTVRPLSLRALPGIARAASAKDSAGTSPKAVAFAAVSFSPMGRNAVVLLRSVDNKDRWLARLDAAAFALRPLFHEQDSSWVGGPNSGYMAWLDEENVLFSSEESGFAHLYRLHVGTGQRTPLSAGRFEVQRAELSRDKKTIYFQSNEGHFGQQHWYRMPAGGGPRQRLTSLPGANEAVLSPDEGRLLVRHSQSNRPWELYVQDNRPAAPPTRLTYSASKAFEAYPWRKPQLVQVPASDGDSIQARLYVPETTNGAAVIFVHGAGYLQNAHEWWSLYFREYMFHNLLADRGYTVLDMDYRASAGYGRNWRTGIYRHMGSKDLDDHVAGADFLKKHHGIDARRIGIYGGSYGGFITLMAMFTRPGVFAAGAALRPVTDWAAYNHGYAANILNEPATDSVAYRRSSPIYHAAGLRGHLLICHGMVDVNVHFQDVVRLVQRLIELKKENWELAVYPVEDHAFTEPSSWTDEYRRILKLFEETLR